MRITAHNKIKTMQQISYESQKGFTLLELTISIALIGIIVLIILGAMRLGLRSVELGEKKVDFLERQRSSINIIDSQIQSYIPVTYEEDDIKKTVFTGERDVLQFSTNYSIWSGQKGYVIVTYKVNTDNSGKQVLLATENVIGFDNVREVELIDKYDEISFEYFYQDPTEESGEWVETWTDETTIPKKVKIHLVDETIDLYLVIPMRVSEFTSKSLRKLIFPFGTL
jgi:general secretion pathway protein J